MKLRGQLTLFPFIIAEKVIDLYPVVTILLKIKHFVPTPSSHLWELAQFVVVPPLEKSIVFTGEVLALTNEIVFAEFIAIAWSQVALSGLFGKFQAARVV